MEIIDSDLDSLRLEAVATSFGSDSKMTFWCKLESMKMLLWRRFVAFLELE